MNDHKEWEREMSVEFGEMMDGIRSKPMQEESLQRSQKAAESIAMTKAAQQRGRMNAQICMMLLFPPLLLIAFLIHKQFDVVFSLAAVGVFSGVSLLSFLVFFWAMIFGRAGAGKVLLDCGPHPTRKLFQRMAFLMVTGAVITVVVSMETFAISFAIFLLVFAVYWWLMSFGRLQVCENGLLLYWSLLPWRKLKSYRWEGETDATLIVQYTTPLAFLGRGALPVAIQQKDAVDALLRRYGIHHQP